MPQDLNALTARRDPVCGYVYKGLAKAPKPGNPDVEVAGDDLGAQGFRVKCHEPALHLTIAEAYGGRTLANNQGVIVPFLRVYLPAETLAGNLQSFYGQATQGSGYTLKCTGQQILSRKVKHVIDPTQLVLASGLHGVKPKKDKPYEMWETINPKDEPCPFAAMPDCPVCTPVRQLKFYICELWHKHQRQVHILNSHAKHDGLIAQTMAHLEERLLVQGGNLSTFPPSLAHIPETENFVRYILKRIPQTVHKIGFGRSAGKQTRNIEHLLHLEIDQEWEEIVKARWGMGPFKINPSNGQAESLMAFYQKHYDVLALQGGIGPLSLPAGIQPALSAAPVAVEVELIDPEEVMGLDVFLPRNNHHTENADRLSTMATFLGLPRQSAITAMKGCWPQKHSSQLNNLHILQVIDCLLAEWSVGQVYPNGEPVYVSADEALVDIRAAGLSGTDRDRAQAWTSKIMAKMQPRPEDDRQKTAES